MAIQQYAMHSMKYQYRPPGIKMEIQTGFVSSLNQNSKWPHLQMCLILKAA